MNLLQDSRSTAELFKEFATSVRLRMCGATKKIGQKWTEISLDFDPLLEENRERLFHEIWNLRSKEWAAVESMPTYYGTMNAIIYRLEEIQQPVNRKLRILSLGAGPGLYEIFLAYVLREARIPATVYALDFAEEMIAFQRAVLAEKTLKIKGDRIPGLEQQGMFAPVVGDMSDLSRFAGKIDLVICNNSLQWVADWRKVVKEIGKAMRPEGGKALMAIHPHEMKLKLDKLELRREHVSRDAIVDEMCKANFEATWQRLMTGGPGSGQTDTMMNRMFLEFKFCPAGARDWREQTGTFGGVQHHQVHD